MRNKGFTLIEVILAMVLIGIIAGITSKLLAQNYVNYNSAKNILGLSTPSNLAMDFFLREIKSAESITSFGSSSLSFVNKDGNAISYTLSNGILYRSINNNTAQIVLTNINSFSLSYYDQSFASTAVASNIRYISMLLGVYSGSLTYQVKGATSLRRLIPA